jgi:hypothetical protein
MAAQSLSGKFYRGDVKHGRPPEAKVYDFQTVRRDRAIKLIHPKPDPGN